MAASKKKFSELLVEYNNSATALDVMFHISDLVHNMDQYCVHREKFIDFDECKFHDIFFKTQNSSTPLERHTQTVFFDCQKFAVFDGVFLPRWETEGILPIVNSTLKTLGRPRLSYVDVCSGTGVIGISTLKLFPKNFDKKNCLVDISRLSVENINKNLKKHSLNCDVVQGDWFDSIISKEFEFITANFPYIGIHDNYDPNILTNDPEAALFASNDGWEHYQKLTNFIQGNEFWKVIVCECSEFHEEKWLKLKKDYDADSQKYPFQISMHKDFNKKFRFVSVIRTSATPALL